MWQSKCTFEFSLLGLLVIILEILDIILLLIARFYKYQVHLTNIEIQKHPNIS